MTETAAYFNLLQVQQDLDIEIAAQLDYHQLSDEAYDDLLAYLLSDAQAVRFYLHNDAFTVGETWKVLRMNEVAMDVVMDLTLSLQMICRAQHQNGWSQLVEIYSEAVGCLRKHEADSSALKDEEELEIFVTPSEAKELVMCNPWLLTLYMIRRSSAIRRLLSNLKAAGKTLPKSASAAAT
ncbi:hypothetical protein LUCX_328 [Xanthomonas phage vB_XciM_LucasX]|nr:hypothetical protein LUCX_328 [Xanthomonas phage vB_XciM_LucasX]